MRSKIYSITNDKSNVKIEILIRNEIELWKINRNDEVPNG
jgi:hypothetical protein